MKCARTYVTKRMHSVQVLCDRGFGVVLVCARSSLVVKHVYAERVLFHVNRLLTFDYSMP